ncbi:MAG: diphthine--ammonia ligase [Nitrososphaeria archaeon]|nr:diphthine--ammonia ligase [Nitrososphaeria archaeon]
MKLAALFSGGKDSTYAIYCVENMGCTVELLLTAYPRSADALYFHYPNIWLTRLQAEAMRKEHILERVVDDELETLKNLIEKASETVEGIVLGVISSNFQKKTVEEICRENNLQLFTPLWSRDPSRLIREIINSDFKVMVTGVAAWGLTREWLGKILTEIEVERLEDIGERFGVNLCGEGGEMETIVLDCPLFTKRLEIVDHEVEWKGDRGFLNILEARLVEKF